MIFKLALSFLTACTSTHMTTTQAGYDYYHANAKQDHNPVVYSHRGKLYIWVPTHKFRGKIIEGHWKEIEDPTNIENYVWIPGHFVGRGKNKRYVTPHWKRVR